MQVRQYRPGDETAIAHLHNSAFKTLIDSLPEIYRYAPIAKEDVLDWINPVLNELWVIETQGIITGYAQTRIEIERGKESIPVLQFMPAQKWDLDQSNIAVHPEYQRRGVGRALIEFILRQHKEVVKFATALTFSDNIAGERLFQRSGFSMHDAFYYTPFSDEHPLANSSVYMTLRLESLKPPEILNPKVVFRRAILQDADLTAEIHRRNVWWCKECRALDWNLQFIKGDFGHTVFVGELNGEIIGEINYYRDGRVGIAGVLPEFRNQGVGSTMFYEVLNEMQKAGFKYAFIDSGLTQTDAIRMYKRFGFTIQRRQNCWVKELR